jgi:hypothetical protein
MGGDEEIDRFQRSANPAVNWKRSVLPQKAKSQIRIQDESKSNCLIKLDQAILRLAICICGFSFQSDRKKKIKTDQAS